MSRGTPGRRAVVLACLMTVLLVSASAWAQSNVGSGPLTSSLADTEPTTGVIDLGPVKVAPGITVREFGWTDNVFDEAVNPKEEYIFIGVPDVALFTRLRFVKVSLYSGMELSYFREYEQERAVGYIGRGRIDLLASRLRPFIGGGRIQTRERANGEIDVRANRLETEVSGGLAFELSETSRLYGSAVKKGTKFQDAFEEGIDVGRTLNRYAYDYNAGLQTDLTPLTKLTLRAGVQKDEFVSEPLRNAENRYGQATISFTAEAVVTGALTVGYTDMRPVDPLVDPFRGVTLSGAMAIPFLELGRFNIVVNRSAEYSFDSTEAYFVSLTGSASYTHRIVGPFDVQALFSRSNFNYGHREGSTTRDDRLTTYQGSVGYNFPNRTRLAVNYELAARRSPALAERNYDRRRIYLSWMFAF